MMISNGNQQDAKGKVMSDINRKRGGLTPADEGELAAKAENMSKTKTFAIIDIGTIGGKPGYAPRRGSGRLGRIEISAPQVGAKGNTTYSGQKRKGSSHAQQTHHRAP
jgi:hypothetical protein